MRTPLQPIWDLALKHWDEVIPDPGTYAACIAEVNKQFALFCEQQYSADEDAWTDSDVLMAAFFYCGYRDMIPGLVLEHKHMVIGITLNGRAKEREYQAKHG